MNVLDKWVKRMDEQDKVGWTKEGFEELEYNDKVAISVYNLLSQVYNGGLTQYYYNGYGFADEFLKEEVAEVLDMPELKEWIEKADDAEFLKQYDLMDELDEEFYKKYAEELEEAICEYLKEEWK